MKKFKLFLTACIMVLSFSILFGCAAKRIDSPRDSYDDPSSYQNDSVNQNEFNEIRENDFTLSSENAFSTFSLDVNTASYSNIRNYINNGYTIDPNMVRIEEMVNYFKYDYVSPTDKPLAISGNIFNCPWNTESKLMRIGVKAQDFQMDDIKNNIIFLIDVSGSMDSYDKIGFIRTSFSLLAQNLNPNDTISIVTYSSSCTTLLDGCKGEDQKTILEKLNGLSAGGSTAGANAINVAYSLAEKHFIEDGNNRVILATDGDFNVGISSQSALEDFISSKRQTGIYLTVLGFGYGNVKDNKLETLALKGNGNYYYIDTLNEAKKVLIDEIGGTLMTVAKDVKAQVEFNPAKVLKYRLIGYENKMLDDEDWENVNADAGEIGAGHVVTAVYEIYLKDSDIQTTLEDNYAKASLKYKNPETEGTDSEILEINTLLDDANIETIVSEDSLFISAVVETGLLLRNSDYKGSANYNSIIERIQGLNCVENDEYKAEFLELVKKLKNKD